MQRARFYVLTSEVMAVCDPMVALFTVQTQLFAIFVTQILAKYANLHTSFETDWFKRRLCMSTPDLDLAANSSALRKSTNGTGNSEVV